MITSYEKKKKIKFKKRVEKVVKTLLRWFCLFLFFHWTFFTEVEKENVSYSWAMLRKDPLNFFLIKPFNDFVFETHCNKEEYLKYLFFFLEVTSKALVFKLVLRYINYSSVQLATTQKKLTNLSNPYLSDEERQKAEKKFLLSLMFPLVNLFFSLTFYIALFFHSSVLKKNEDLFPKLKNYQLFALNVSFNLLFRTSQEFVQQRRILTKKELKEFLARNLLLSVGENLFHFFLLPLIFHVHYKNLGEILIMVSSMLIDFLINTVESFSSSQPIVNEKVSEKGSRVDWKNKIAELERTN